MVAGAVREQAGAMTTTPPEAPTGPTSDGPDQGPRATRDEIKDLGRLRRSATDRKVAGVAGGLARHLDIDPLVLRVAFVVLAFFGGAGLLMYGACWLLVPEEETGHAPVTLDERSRTVALLVVGVLAAFAVVGDSWGYFWFPWPLAIIAVVVLVIVMRKDRNVPPVGSTQGPGWVPPSGYPAHGGTAPGGPASADPAAPYTATPYEYTPYQYTPPAGPTYVPRPVARDPRRRGPKLFWFTVALIMLGEGLLGTADVAGVAVADAAYPALAVGLVGVMLLVGAFYGRAGGLILLGLLATIGMAGATASDSWESDGGINEAPRTAAAVSPRYDFGAGELELNLVRVTDPQALDGRTIRIEGGAGSIDVIVPDDMDVDVEAQVGGPGSIQLFGLSSDGIDTSRNASYDGGEDVPHLTLIVDLGFGEIHVDTE
jgi:phage shock protein PspC (stress-responsive transcriptional regulator)